MTIAVGQWYRIKPAKDNGGIPLVRVESVAPEVVVSDWVSFDERFVDAPLACGYVRPNPRRFSMSLDEATRMLRRYWTLVRPHATSDAQTAPQLARPHALRSSS